MSIKRDKHEKQARSFRAAAIGSVISDNTLGVTEPREQSPKSMVLPESIASTGRSWRDGIGGLRDYLRRRRLKRRERRVDQLRQALISAGVISAQSESLRRLAMIEEQLSLVSAGICVIENQIDEVRTSLGVGLGLRTDALFAKAEIINARVDALVNRNLIQLTDDHVAARTPYGYVICPQSGYHLVIYLSEGGVHEPGTCRVIESIIEPGDHVIDVGAQVGFLTLVMARAVGVSGSVLALEASEVMAECIRRTLSINGLLENCHIVHTAVADRTGTAKFNLAEQSSHSSLFPLSEEAQEVEVRTAALDDLVSNGDRIALVKVDVEGAELLVLQGMSRLVRDNPEVILVVEFGPSHLARVGQTIDNWLGEFRNCGFDCIFEIDEQSAACRPLRCENELSMVHSMNLVFARSDSSRILRIPQS